MAAQPLVGGRISLISKKDIRYEGILYDINTGEATVSLKDGKATAAAWAWASWRP